MKLNSIKKLSSATLSLLVFITNGFLPHAVQANIWKQRNESIQLARLPLHPHQLTQPVIPAMDSNINKRAPHLSHSDSKLDEILRSLSNPYGSIRDVTNQKYHKNKPIIVHIQDIHMNDEAQTHIAANLQSLINRKQVDLIALEGAFDDIDLSPLRTFPYQPAVQKAARYLIREHDITGPIYAALSSKADVPPVVGIDDKAHYEANVKAFRLSSKVQEARTKDIQKRKTEIQKKKVRTFNSDLWEFDQSVRLYREETISMGEYIDTLIRYEPGAPLSLSIFNEAYQLEHDLNLSQVEHERALLLKDLLPNLSARQKDAFAQMSVAFRKKQVNHAQFYKRLQSLSRQAGVPLSRYPAMRDYVHYILLSDSLDGETLIADMNATQRKILGRLALTTKEKELTKLDRMIYLQGKLVQFGLTKTEWEEYKKEHGAWRPAHEPEDQNASRNSNGMDLSSFENFYHEAEQRDTAMAANLKMAMEQHNAGITVLVTGGFHARGMKTHLRDSTPNFVSWVPRITKIQETSQQSSYLSVFSQQKTPLDQLFEGQKLFLTQKILAGPAQAKAVIAAAIDTLRFAPAYLPHAKRLLKRILNRLDAEIIHMGKLVYKITGRPPVALKYAVNDEIENMYLLEGIKTLTGTFTVTGALLFLAESSFAGPFWMMALVILSRTPPRVLSGLLPWLQKDWSTTAGVSLNPYSVFQASSAEQTMANGHAFSLNFNALVIGILPFLETGLLLFVLHFLNLPLLYAVLSFAFVHPDVYKGSNLNLLFIRLSQGLVLAGLIAAEPTGLTSFAAHAAYNALILWARSRPSRENRVVDFIARLPLAAAGQEERSYTFRIGRSNSVIKFSRSRVKFLDEALTASRVTLDFEPVYIEPEQVNVEKIKFGQAKEKLLFAAKTDPARAAAAAQVIMELTFNESSIFDLIGETHLSASSAIRRYVQNTASNRQIPFQIEQVLHLLKIADLIDGKSEERDVLAIFDDVAEPVILVVGENPDINLMKQILYGAKEKVEAIIINGPYDPSHWSSVEAQALGIPVVGDLVLEKNVRLEEEVTDGKIILFNTYNNTVTVGQGDEERVSRSLEIQEATFQVLGQWKDRPARTEDNKTIHVSGTLIDFPHKNEIKEINLLAGGNVGLFRTEMLFLKKDREENELVNKFTNLAQQLSGTLRVRAVDRRPGDKNTVFDTKPDHEKAELKWLLETAAGQKNLKKLIRVLIRVNQNLGESSENKVKFFVPMVESRAQVDQVIQIIGDVRNEMDDLDTPLPFGIMIETEVHEAELQKIFNHPKIDFISIGTRDLFEFHQARDVFDVDFLSSIKRTILTAVEHNKEIHLCGEHTSNEYLILFVNSLDIPDRLLPGWSIVQNNLSRIKTFMRSMNISNLKTAIKGRSSFSKAEAVLSYVRNRMKGYIQESPEFEEALHAVMIKEGPARAIREDFDVQNDPTLLHVEVETTPDTLSRSALHHVSNDYTLVNLLGRLAVSSLKFTGQNGNQTLRYLLRFAHSRIDRILGRDTRANWTLAGSEGRRVGKSKAGTLPVGTRLGFGSDDRDFLALSVESPRGLTRGEKGTITARVYGERGVIQNFPDAYMAKVVVSQRLTNLDLRDVMAKARIDGQDNVNLKRLASQVVDQSEKELGENPKVGVMMRDHHKGMIETLIEKYALMVTFEQIKIDLAASPDGHQIYSSDIGVLHVYDYDDWSGALTFNDEGGLDVLMGIGGTPESQLTAALMRKMGGAMAATLAPAKNEPHFSNVEKAEFARRHINELHQVLTLDDMINGKAYQLAVGVSVLRDFGDFPGPQVLEDGKITAHVLWVNHVGKIKPVKLTYHTSLSRARGKLKRRPDSFDNQVDEVVSLLHFGRYEKAGKIIQTQLDKYSAESEKFQLWKGLAAFAEGERQLKSLSPDEGKEFFPTLNAALQYEMALKLLTDDDYPELSVYADRLNLRKHLRRLHYWLRDYYLNKGDITAGITFSEYALGYTEKGFEVLWRDNRIRFLKLVTLYEEWDADYWARYGHRPDNIERVTQAYIIWKNHRDGKNCRRYRTLLKRRGVPPFLAFLYTTVLAEEPIDKQAVILDSLRTIPLYRDLLFKMEEVVLPPEDFNGWLGDYISQYEDQPDRQAMEREKMGHERFVIRPDLENLLPRMQHRPETPGILRDLILAAVSKYKILAALGYDKNAKEYLTEARRYANWMEEYSNISGVDPDQYVRLLFVLYAIKDPENFQEWIKSVNELKAMYYTTEDNAARMRLLTEEEYNEFSTKFDHQLVDDDVDNLLAAFQNTRSMKEQQYVLSVLMRRALHHPSAESALIQIRRMMGLPEPKNLHDLFFLSEMEPHDVFQRTSHHDRIKIHKKVFQFDISGLYDYIDSVFVKPDSFEQTATQANYRQDQLIEGTFQVEPNLMDRLEERTLAGDPLGLLWLSQTLPIMSELIVILRSPERRPENVESIGMELSAYLNLVALLLIVESQNEFESRSVTNNWRHKIDSLLKALSQKPDANLFKIVASYPELAVVGTSAVHQHELKYNFNYLLEDESSPGLEDQREALLKIFGTNEFEQKRRLVFDLDPEAQLAAFDRGIEHWDSDLKHEYVVLNLLALFHHLDVQFVSQPRDLFESRFRNINNLNRLDNQVLTDQVKEFLSLYAEGVYENHAGAELVFPLAYRLLPLLDVKLDQQHYRLINDNRDKREQDVRGFLDLFTWQWVMHAAWMSFFNVDQPPSLTSALGRSPDWFAWTKSPFAIKRLIHFSPIGQSNQTYFDLVKGEEEYRNVQENIADEFYNDKLSESPAQAISTYVAWRLLTKAFPFIPVYHEIQAVFTVLFEGGRIMLMAWLFPSEWAQLFHLAVFLIEHWFNGSRQSLDFIKPAALFLAYKWIFTRPDLWTSPHLLLFLTVVFMLHLFIDAASFKKRAQSPSATNRIRKGFRDFDPWWFALQLKLRWTGIKWTDRPKPHQSRVLWKAFSAIPSHVLRKMKGVQLMILTDSKEPSHSSQHRIVLSLDDIENQAETADFADAPATFEDRLTSTLMEDVAHIISLHLIPPRIWRELLLRTNFKGYIFGSRFHPVNGIPVNGDLIPVISRPSFWVDPSGQAIYHMRADSSSPLDLHVDEDGRAHVQFEGRDFDLSYLQVQSAADYYFNYNPLELVGYLTALLLFDPLTAREVAIERDLEEPLRLIEEHVLGTHRALSLDVEKKGEVVSSLGRVLPQVQDLQASVTEHFASSMWTGLDLFILARSLKALGGYGLVVGGRLTGALIQYSHFVDNNGVGYNESQTLYLGVHPAYHGIGVEEKLWRAVEHKRPDEPVVRWLYVDQKEQRLIEYFEKKGFEVDAKIEDPGVIRMVRYPSSADDLDGIRSIFKRDHQIEEKFRRLFFEFLEWANSVWWLINDEEKIRFGIKDNFPDKMAVFGWSRPLFRIKSLQLSRILWERIFEEIGDGKSQKRYEALGKESREHLVHLVRKLSALKREYPEFNEVYPFEDLAESWLTTKAWDLFSKLGFVDAESHKQHAWFTAIFEAGRVTLVSILLYYFYGISLEFLMGHLIHLMVFLVEHRTNPVNQSRGLVPGFLVYLAYLLILPTPVVLPLHAAHDEKIHKEYAFIQSELAQTPTSIDLNGTASVQYVDFNRHEKARRILDKLARSKRTHLIPVPSVDLKDMLEENYRRAPHLIFRLDKGRLNPAGLRQALRQRGVSTVEIFVPSRSVKRKLQSSRLAVELEILRRDAADPLAVHAYVRTYFFWSVPVPLESLIADVNSKLKSFKMMLLYA